MKLNLLILLSLIFTITGCEKRANSDFTLNKYEYRPGEMIEITNLDSHKRNQIWEITGPNGTVIECKEESNPQFLIDILAENGSYGIHLYDNKRDKEDDVKKSKDFLVKSKKGILNIYNTNLFSPNFSTYIDGHFVGESEGSVEYTLPIGMRVIEIVGDLESTTRTLTVEITEDYEEYIYL